MNIQNKTYSKIDANFPRYRPSYIERKEDEKYNSKQTDSKPKKEFSDIYSKEQIQNLELLKKELQKRKDKEKISLNEGDSKIKPLYEHIQNTFKLSIEVYTFGKKNNREDFVYLSTFIYELALLKYKHYKKLTSYNKSSS
ncbi:MAG: hypothetical protein ACLFPL_03850 [Candidatus Nanoarchaeia archaeon]